jgi:hypothetical protein
LGYSVRHKEKINKNSEFWLGCVGFEVFTAATLKIIVFWDVTLPPSSGWKNLCSNAI